MNKLIKLIILALVYSTTQTCISAQSIGTKLSANQVSSKNLDFRAKYSVFVDSTNRLGIQNIMHKEFVSYNTDLLNLGINEYANWIKLDIYSSNQNDNNSIEIANPILDYILYFKTLNNQILDSSLMGEVVPFENRNNNLRSYVIDLKLDSGVLYTYYFKVKSSEQLNLPVFITSKEKLQLRETGNNIIDGIYFGIILVMVLYNLFIFLSTKDTSYFYYIIYIFTVGFTQAVLNGYTFKYIWPNQTFVTQYSTITSGVLSGIATIFFIRNFLNTKRYSPKFHKLLYLFLLLYFVIGILLLLGKLNLAYQLTNFNAGVGSFILLLTAINVYFKYKNRTALLFIFAWSIFILSIIVFVLKDLGVIPYSVLSVKGLQIGSACEVILLSIALADKINILKQDKDRAQAKALSIANENARIIQEQNVVLEHKVIERTKALSETNNNLSVALDELKFAQTQLVESEKMASLGQLTAGIAHEINNPINFVTSNVKPLHRDILELYKLQDETEKYIQENGLPLTNIEKIKQAIDYEYLKTEINYLLKGINEGSARTAEIVKGLRIFSRVDEDDIKLANINEGLDSTIIIVNNQLNNKIEIEKYYANLPLIDCYPGKLNQVFLNLISNAIYAVKEKFGDEHGGKITIKTELVGENITISITDNGTGMSEATKNKLFEPFFTTKPVGDGTGLGLSIVYNTIKKHKGVISATSELGVGTSFTISIPQRHINEQSKN
jgi:signal transduction histidine kinase